MFHASVWDLLLTRIFPLYFLDTHREYYVRKFLPAVAVLVCRNEHRTSLKYKVAFISIVSVQE